MYDSCEFYRTASGKKLRIGVMLSLLETGEGHEKDRSLKQSSISTEMF